MVKITKDEQVKLTAANDSLKLAQQRMELENARVTAMVLGLYDKYKVDKDVFGITLSTGEFTKKEK